MRIAFLGLGRMGVAMAAHVARAGHDLTVWNRSPGKAGPLLELGATGTSGLDALAGAVSGAQVVVLMLTGPEAVAAVLAEVAAAAAPGTLVIDSSTIGVQAAAASARTCAAAGLRYVDAPVTGSIAPATDGTLGVLAGCSEADFAAARPILECWGAPEKVRRVGEAGSGSAMKLVINASLASAMAGLGEALRLAADLGLDERAAMEVLAIGPMGWTLAQKKQMLLDRDVSATTFSIDLIAKDIDLSLAAGTRDYPMTQAVRALVQQTQDAGYGDADYAALALFLRDGDG